MTDHSSSPDIVDLLRRARQFVSDAGSDEDDMEVNLARIELVEEMDAALRSARSSAGNVEAAVVRLMPREIACDDRHDT